MTVRLATESDVLDILVLFKQFHMEAPTHYVFDANKTSGLFTNLINGEDGNVFLLENGKGVVGMLVAIFTESLFSHQKIATELAWYVSKEHRGTKGSIALVKEFEAWGAAKGADIIVMSDISDLKNIENPYKRLGYELTECSYFKEV